MIVKFNFTHEDIAHIQDEMLSELFSEAARSSLLGYHRIIISRSLAKWAADNLDLTTKHRKHILRLGQDFTQLGGQACNAKYKMLVCPKADSISYDNNGTWTIGIAHALPEGFLSQTTLVLENAKNDGDFYNLILSQSAKNLRFGDISYAIAHGGGSGSGNEVKRIFELGKAVSCICDTDLKVRGGAASDTFNSVMAVKCEINPIGAIVGTPAREVENFLPLSIVRKITTKHDELDYIESLIRKQETDVSPGDCLWLFIDIKDGFPEGVLDSYCRSAEARQWVSRKFNVPDNEIQNISISPLGQNVLSEFMRCPQMKSELHKHIRSTYWATHFKEWVWEVLWALAGRKRERVS